MRIASSVGAGSLLSSATRVKPEKQKSFRASKQAAPALPPPSKNAARVPRSPIPPPPIPAGVPVLELDWISNEDHLALVESYAELSPGPDPFILTLVRPPRPDGSAAVHWHNGAAPVHGEHLATGVLARLVPWEPYELYLDGALVGAEDGKGWQGRRRVRLTIKGNRAEAEIVPVSIISDAPVPLQDGFLFVATRQGYSVEVRCGGRLLFAEPEAEKGGQC